MRREESSKRCMYQTSFLVTFDPKKPETWGTRNEVAGWLLSERPTLTSGSNLIHFLISLYSCNI